MSYRLRTSVAGFVVACGVFSSPLYGDDIKDLMPGAKIVMHHGPIVHKPQLNVVIRSAEELVSYSSKPLKSKDRDVQQETSSALAKLFKVDAIDWDKQMVVGVLTGGGRGDAGNLKFVSLHVQGRTLTVRYAGPSFPDHVCASNSGLALVNRFDGMVQFVDTNAPKASDR